MSTVAFQRLQDAGEADSNCKSRCIGALPYAKVALQGLIVCAGVSGIWSFLSGVSSVITFPTLHISGATFHDGIICTFVGTKRYTEFQNQFCDGIAEEMANQTVSHPEWHCHNLVDNDSNLVTQFAVMRHTFIALVVSAVIGALFPVLHDWTLIYYQRQDRIQTLVFWPQQSLSEHFGISAWMRHNSVQIYTYLVEDALSDRSIFVYVLVICCCPLIFAVLVVIVFILIPLLFVCLFLELIFRNLLYIALCKCDPLCRGMIETSAVWVGIARFFVVWYAHSFTFCGYSGILMPIEDPLSTSCTCYCAYALYPWDFAKFLFAAYVLTVSNLLFIKTWKTETHFEHYFLYLVSHPVSIWISGVINKRDTTGSLITEQKAFMTAVELRVLDRSDSNDVSATQLNDAVDNTESKKAATKCRKCLYLWAWGYSMLFVGYGLISMATTQKVTVIWGWPEWIVYILYTGCVPLFIGFPYMLSGFLKLIRES